MGRTPPSNGPSATRWRIGLALVVLACAILLRVAAEGPWRSLQAHGPGGHGWVATRPDGECEECGFAGGELRKWWFLCAGTALGWLLWRRQAEGFLIAALFTFGAGLVIMAAAEPWAVAATFRLGSWSGHGIGAVQADPPGLLHGGRAVVGWGAVVATLAFVVAVGTCVLAIVLDDRDRARTNRSDHESPSPENP